MTKIEIALTISVVVEFIGLLVLAVVLFRRQEKRLEWLEEMVVNHDDAVDELLEENEQMQKAVVQMIETSRAAYEKYDSLEEAITMPLPEKRLNKKN